MALLNEAQLTFEGDTHRIPFRRPDLGPISEELQRQLAGIAAYIRRVLFEFESDPTLLVSGGDSLALASCTRYLRFVQYDNESVRDFTTEVVIRMTRIDQLV